MQRKRGIQENERNRDIFKKIVNIKGTLHVRMDMLKDRNNSDLIETKVIKKRCQEYKELYKIRGLNEPNNHDDVVTHLEPDILECELKLGLRKHYYEQSR